MHVILTVVQRSDEDNDLVTVCFEEEGNRMKDSVTAKEAQSLRWEQMSATYI